MYGIPVVCTAPQMYDTGNEWEQSRLDGADDISSAYEYITRWGGVGGTCREGCSCAGFRDEAAGWRGAERAGHVVGEARCTGLLRCVGSG